MEAEPSDRLVSEEEEEEEVDEELMAGISSSNSFDTERHVVYLEMLYRMLPDYFESQEINRITLAYFVISGLRILGAIDRINKDEVADWVLSLQFQPRNSDDLNNGEFFGFNGSRSSQFPPNDDGVLTNNGSHLASTYCALAILKTIGYDFSNFDSKSLLISMRNLQQPDGSYIPIHIGGEADLRFVYCAAAISFILGDWSGMDRQKAKEYILNCQSYDGGFGMSPGLESHGGAMYCAIASLQLMGFIEDDLLSGTTQSPIINVESLIDWSLQRRASDGGYQGRPNKSSDTCYAFWIGASLKIIGGYKFVDKNGLRRFLLTCQSQYGGFSKFPWERPDLYHSFYGCAAFSLLEEADLGPFCPELGIAQLADLGI